MSLMSNARLSEKSVCQVMSLERRRAISPGLGQLRRFLINSDMGGTLCKQDGVEHGADHWAHLS